MKTTGTVDASQQLIFASGSTLLVKAVESSSIRTTIHKIGLLVATEFESRQMLLDQGLLGTTAFSVS